MMHTSTKQYLYSEINEEQRNILQHNLIKPTILKLLPQMLENYGLRQQLEAARKNRSQLVMLEAGSGSGSFLHDLADFLNEQGLLPAANLNGLDLKLDYVMNAEQQNGLKPAWANLNYYQHDLALPLEDNFSLKLEKKLEFDCIFAMVLLEYLPNAQQHLLELYQRLKPGGLLYLCDLYMAYDGEPRIIAPNPVIEEFGRMGIKAVRSLNGGKIIAEETAAWLQEAGADVLQVVKQVVQTSDSEQVSLDILRYFIALVRSVSPALLAMGLIDQAKHEKFLTSVFQVDRASFAQIPFIHTLVRKPVQS